MGPGKRPDPVGAGLESTPAKPYVINDIKPGTKPSFQVQQNPSAFVSYDSPPGKLTMLSAGAGVAG